MPLNGWTPHQVHKTSELAQLQLDCMKDVDKWLWDCAEARPCLVAMSSKPITGQRGEGVGRELASEQTINMGGAEHAPLDQHFEVNAIRDAFRRHTGVRSGQISNRAIGDALEAAGPAAQETHERQHRWPRPQMGLLHPRRCCAEAVYSGGEPDQRLC